MEEQREALRRVLALNLETMAGLAVAALITSYDGDWSKVFEHIDRMNQAEVAASN